MNPTDHHSNNGPPGLSAGYFQAPDLIFDLPLSANEKLVLIYFMRRADREGKCFPSASRICRDCGIKSSNTVRKAVKGLEKAGLVEKRRVTGSPHYYIVSKEFYGVIQAAKDNYSKKKEAAGDLADDDRVSHNTPHIDNMLMHKSSPTPSKFEP